jgi:hypothetical protein
LRLVDGVDLLDKFTEEVGLGSEGNGGFYEKIWFVFERLANFKSVLELNVLEMN